jgi:hypothetical protein
MGEDNCSRSLLFAVRAVVEEFVGHSWSLSATGVVVSPCSNGSGSSRRCGGVGSPVSASKIPVGMAT